MNNIIFRVKAVLIFLTAAAGLSSCLVSSRTDVDVFNRREYANTVSVKTIRVPLFIGKPILRTYLRFEEDVPREVLNLFRGVRKIRVTLAETNNTRLVDDFRASIQDLPGEEWISVHNGSQWVYLKGDQHDKDVIKRITVAVSDPETSRLVVVNMKCKLTPAQLSTLVNYALNSEEGKRLLAGNFE